MISDFGTRKLLERADRAIEESVRLRALNREIREKAQIAFSEVEWQISRPSQKVMPPE